MVTSIVFIPPVSENPYHTVFPDVKQPSEKSAVAPMFDCPVKNVPSRAGTMAVEGKSLATGGASQFILASHPAPTTMELEINTNVMQQQFDLIRPGVGLIMSGVPVALLP